MSKSESERNIWIWIWGLWYTHFFHACCTGLHQVCHTAQGILVLDKYVHEPAVAAKYESCTTCYSHPIVVFMCGLCGHSSCCLSHLCRIKAKNVWTPGNKWLVYSGKAFFSRVPSWRKVTLTESIIDKNSNLRHGLDFMQLSNFIWGSVTKRWTLYINDDIFFQILVCGGKTW